MFRLGSSFSPVLLLILLVPGCQGDTHPDSLRPGEIVIPDAPVEDAGLEALWRAPSEEDAEDGSQWANPNRMAIGDGYVAVLDPTLSRVHLFSEAGERTGSFGRAGAGPGEFAQPLRIGVKGDSILVQTAQNSLDWFGKEGAHLGSVSGGGVLMTEVHLVPGRGIVRSGFRAGDPDAGFHEQWELIGQDGIIREVTMPGPHPLQPGISEGREGCWQTGTVGRALARVACTFPLVQILGTEGEIVQEYRIDREPQETPESLLEEAIQVAHDRIARQASETGIQEVVRDQMMEQREASLRQEAQWLPVMRDIAGSPSGHRIALWEQIPGDLGGGNATVHVLDEEGRYLIRHAFGTQLSSIGLSDDHVFVLAEDTESGVRRLEAYRLP